MEIEVRFLKEGEEAAVNELFNLTYHHRRSMENFMWEFFNGPFGKAIYVVAYDNEKKKIVGTQSAIPIEFISGDGEKILTAKSEDTLLDPAYRGKGLFDKMYNLLFKACADAGIKYIWGFTYAKKPFLKVGFEIPFETVQGVYTMNPERSYRYLSNLNPANKFSEKLKIFGLSWISFLKSVLSRTPGKINEAAEVKEDLNFERDLFIKNAISGTNEKYWTINFSPSYIKWRLRNNPYKNHYQLLTAVKGNREVADIIINTRGEGYAYLEQLIFDNELIFSFKKQLILKLLGQLRSKNVFLVRFWGFLQNDINAQEVDLLKKCGFIFVRKGTAFVWKNLEEVKGSQVKPSNLLLSRLFTQGNS
jgi:GNAT superfamily N-acetyltransferase